MRLTAIVLCAFLVACHDHGGHDAQEDRAGPEAKPNLAITRFSKDAELFVEIPPLVAGQATTIAAHLTTLSDSRAVTSGTFHVVLSGGGGPEERFEVAEVANPGIFRLELAPKHAGARTATAGLRAGKIEAAFELGTLTVHADEAAAGAAPAPKGEGGGIAFLKEQQWRMDFATTSVEPRKLRASFEAYGTIRPRADGHALVTPPVAGRLRARDAFPRVGAEVQPDQVLAAMTPSLVDLGDRASLRQASLQAKIGLDEARSERERLEKLLSDGVVPERRVIAARFAEQQAAAASKTARQRLGQASSMQGAGRRGGDFELRAPIGGTIVGVSAAAGAFVEPGAPLFHIVDLDELWLEVHVAEAHAPLIDTPRGVWFRVEGVDDPIEVGPERVVTVGGMLDARSRTVPLFVQVDNAARRLRVGMFADVSVVIGEATEALAVPQSAVSHEAGLPFVYVQRGGESFERRQVRLGDRDGAFVGVTDGLSKGERVVSRGAYAVRLAAFAGAAPEHGHEH